MNKSYMEDLIRLIQENPDMEVLCMVDSDIVADDGYSWWLGMMDEKKPPEIKEYSTNINEELTFRDDEDYEYWFECKFDVDDFPDISDSEWEDFMRNKVDEVAKWKKAIFIKVIVGGTS